MKPKAFYAVVVGADAGVHTDFSKVLELTEGLPGTRFRGFNTRHEASAYFEEAMQSGLSDGGAASPETGTASEPKVKAERVPPNSAAPCSAQSVLPRSLPDLPLAPELPKDGEAEDSDDEVEDVTEIMRARDLEELKKSSIDLSCYVDDEELVPLDEHQQAALDMVMKGQNVFITGVAGTGKSLLLKHIQMALKDREFVVMAPTGIAAVNVNGCTLNSYCGIGMPKTKSDFEKMWSRKKQLRKVEVMIIDEISMCSGEMLDNIEAQIRTIRQDPGNRAFGGVQVIVCGDFLQLPPVQVPPGANDLRYKKHGKVHLARVDEVFLNRGYAFQAECWKRSEIQTVRLTHVHRQGGEKQMVQALQAIRQGNITSDVTQLVTDCRAALETVNGIIPTKLYCKNIDVDRENHGELMTLEGGLVTFLAKDQIEAEVKQRSLSRNERYLLNRFFEPHQCRVKKVLELKVGAQVMLLQNENIGSKLVNGSRGVVVGIKTAIEHCKELNERIKKALQQGDPSAAAELERELAQAETHDFSLLPVVKFTSRAEPYTILPHGFSREVRGLGSAIRFQIPLKLAWAITIHKSQGMSIDRLIVFLQDAFADGQAYVALSRSTSKAGLQVVGFSDRCIKTSSLAVDFESGHADIVSWLEEARKTWDDVRRNILEEFDLEDARVYPNCQCNVESKRVQVRKAGTNQGRFFFCCSKQRNDPLKCNFFGWDVPQTAPPPASIPPSAREACHAQSFQKRKMPAAAQRYPSQSYSQSSSSQSSSSSPSKRKRTDWDAVIRLLSPPGM
jgi:ATP-dependent DNA helicase PIF1